MNLNSSTRLSLSEIQDAKKILEDMNHMGFITELWGPEARRTLLEPIPFAHLLPQSQSKISTFQRWKRRRAAEVAELLRKIARMIDGQE